MKLIHVVNVAGGGISASRPLDETDYTEYRVTIHVPGGYAGLDLTAEQLADFVSETDRLLPEYLRIGQ